MNRWIELSIEYASQRSYLDDLFPIYPTIPDGMRDIPKDIWNGVEKHFNRQDNDSLLKLLLKLKLFPIKDSYVAYLKKDAGALQRNPKTANRICGRLYELGLDEIFKRCSEPKETNRQIGPMFKNWLKKKSLGVIPIPLKEFEKSKTDAILDASDAEMQNFARRRLNYNRDKGLDFVGRFGGRYVIGEAKFLTDFGGHQNAQFADAMSTLETKGVDAIIIAVLDGVLYIKGRHKLHKGITDKKHNDSNIMSALLLREFLYSIR